MTLSICIPTHHGRRAQLARAIESVTAQLDEQTRPHVRICVFDNGSQDGTSELLAELGGALGELIACRRNDVELAPGASVLQAAEMATGHYLWLLGSDDELASGALARVLALLAEHPGLAGMTVNKVNMDPTMTQELPGDPPMLAPAEPDTLHVYSDPERIFADCGLAHGFMSAQICHRPQWRAALAGTNAETSAGVAPHLLAIERMVLANPSWLWCPDRLVRQCNAGAPPEFERPLYAYGLQIIGDVEPIWARLFGRGNPIYQSLMERWYAFGANPTTLAHLKSQPGITLIDDVRMLVGFARTGWRLRYFYRRSLPMLLVPHSLAVRALATFRRRRAQWGAWARTA